MFPAPFRPKDSFYQLLLVFLFVNLLIPILVPVWISSDSRHGDALMITLPPVLAGAHCFSKAITPRERRLGVLALVVGFAWLTLLAFSISKGDFWK